MRELLLKVTPFTSFTTKMAEIVCGDVQVGKLIRKLIMQTTMLNYDGIATYVIIDIFKEFLFWELQENYSSQNIKNLYSRAGVYYEMKGQLAEALACYAKCGDSRKISELLMRHAQLNPALASYYDVEEYYRALPHKEILRSPILMCAMSMLCALTLDFDGSDFWYQELKKYADTLQVGDGEYAEVQGRIAYLDISLPHRGKQDIMEMLLNLYKLKRAHKIVVPSFSVTSNLPSILNGGRDFSSWTKRDDFLYASIGKAVEYVVGQDGVGLADCALFESKYEKDENDQGRLLKLISRLSEIQSRGTPDIEFAVVGQFIREQVMCGKGEEALATLHNLRERFVSLGLKRFFANMDALECRIQLCLGDKVAVDTWYREKAPKDFLHLRAMKRYCYTTSAMVELAHGAYEKCLLTMAQLEPYYKKCGRNLDLIDLKLLQALARYGLQDSQWEENLAEALDLCSEYHFIRPVSEGGSALLPLLMQTKWSRNSEFLAKLKKATRKVAIYYPNFLCQQKTLIEPLTDAEKQVLKLICHNLSNEEIGKVLNIRVSTVKTHVSHILQKMDIKRRSAARDLALKLHIFPSDSF